MRPRYETRRDGWPLCPVCGEDELYSLFFWDGEGERPSMQAWIDHGLRCYRCSYDSQQGVVMQPPYPPPIVAPAAPPQDRSTVVKRGGYMVCVLCGLMIDYCRCGTTPAGVGPPTEGAAAAGLERRIREAQKR